MFAITSVEKISIGVDAIVPSVYNLYMTWSYLQYLPVNKQGSQTEHPDAMYQELDAKALPDRYPGSNSKITE